MKVAIVTLDQFNELDSMVASAILGRVTNPSWDVRIVGDSETLTSMNGLQIQCQAPLSFANQADCVIFGSGMRTDDYANDPSFLRQFALDPERQIIGSQCSGALILHRLGLVRDCVSTDTMTAPKLEGVGVTAEPVPLSADGNVASAGGCLSAHYLAAWVIAKKLGWEKARDIIHYVAPVGQKDDYIRRAEAVILPLL